MFLSSLFLIFCFLPKTCFFYHNQTVETVKPRICFVLYRLLPCLNSHGNYLWVLVEFVKLIEAMDKEKEENAASGGVNVTEKKRLSQANSEAMEKCLEENKGDNTKCKDKVEAFRSSSSTSSPTKPLRRFIVRSGSLSDV